MEELPELLEPVTPTVQRKSFSADAILDLDELSPVAGMQLLGESLSDLPPLIDGVSPAVEMKSLGSMNDLPALIEGVSPSPLGNDIKSKAIKKIFADLLDVSQHSEQSVLVDDNARPNFEKANSCQLLVTEDNARPSFQKANSCIELNTGGRSRKTRRGGRRKRGYRGNQRRSNKTAKDKRGNNAPSNSVRRWDSMPASRQRSNNGSSSPPSLPTRNYNEQSNLKSSIRRWESMPASRKTTNQGNGSNKSPPCPPQRNREEKFSSHDNKIGQDNAPSCPGRKNCHLDVEESCPTNAATIDRVLCDESRRRFETDHCHHFDAAPKCRRRSSSRGRLDQTEESMSTLRVGGRFCESLADTAPKYIARRTERVEKKSDENTDSMPMSLTSLVMAKTNAEKKKKA